MVSYGLTQLPTRVAFTGPHTQSTFTWSLTGEGLPLYHIVTLPGNVGNTLNWSLPFTLQCTLQVCGHHMALLPSFPGSELAAMWHVANPACICLAFCSTKHYFVTCCSPKQICPQYFLTYCSPRPKNIVFCFSFIYDDYCYNLGDVKVTTGWC